MKAVVAIGVCSYDILSGISVPQKWQFVQNENVKIHEVFRMSLINALRQDQSLVVEEFVCSTFEIPTYSCFAAFAQFGIKNKAIVQPYSVGIFLDLARMHKTPQILDMLMSYARNLASGAKLLVTRSQPLDKLRELACRYEAEINRILGAKVENDYSVLNYRNDLFARVVTSHLQTQMTTVIEAATLEEAKELFGLLLLFMLPYQRELVCDQVLPTAVPHLFLQIVKPQVAFEEQILAMQGPCTWIRIAEKQIYQVPVSEKPPYEYVDLCMATLVDEDIDKKKLQSLKGQIKQFSGPCPIVASQLNVIRDASLPKLVCGQLLSSIVRQALTFIALVDDYIRTYPNCDVDMRTEVKKHLMLKKDDDLVVLAVAKLFDPRILVKWNSPLWAK